MKYILAKARQLRVRRGNRYRDQTLKIMSWICAWCGRRFTGNKRHELTMHRKPATTTIDRNAIGFYRYSSNFEFLMTLTVPIFILKLISTYGFSFDFVKSFAQVAWKTYRQINIKVFRQCGSSSAATITARDPADYGQPIDGR